MDTELGIDADEEDDDDIEKDEEERQLDLTVRIDELFSVSALCVLHQFRYTFCSDLSHLIIFYDFVEGLHH